MFKKVARSTPFWRRATHEQDMTAITLPDELWDIDQLAAYLKVGRRYVYRLTSEGRIRFNTLGGQLRFDPRDVAAFLANEAVRPGEPVLRPKRGRPRAAART